MTEPYIVTYTGRKIPLLEPHPDHIDARDIAHSLAYQCRFTGHTPRHYSVAEHSIRVAWQIRGKYANPTGWTPLRVAKVALLHDAAEAYLGDVSTPLKSLLPEYQRIENNWQHAVFVAFGLDDYLDHIPAVHEADQRMQGIEINWFFDNPEEFGVEREDIPRVIGYTADEAEELFLSYLRKWATV